MLPDIPAAWRPLLDAETKKPFYQQLDAFLDAELAAGQTVLPPRDDIFNALKFTPLDRVKVLLVGQDPYPKPGDAHGLCFSVRREVHPIPASLKNMFEELRTDVGFTPPIHGNLEAWARQGVLMLNTVLTVRAHQPNSHKKRGWETLTQRIIQLVDARPTRVVFLLMGAQAQQAGKLVTGAHHAVVQCAHPSPLSAKKFHGCRCFSAVNRLLTEKGIDPIDWQIPA
jgi:uracil-DNA glycosylase